MNIITTEFPDVKIIEPDVYRDNRGYLFETFNVGKFTEIIGDFEIKQGNQTKSKCGVIRGIHFQKPPHTQAKIIEVIKGEVLNVIVDIRTDSPMFGKYFSTILSGTNKKLLYIPRGFAHGSITLTKDAIFQHYVDNNYSPKHEGGIIYSDSNLNINWIKKYKIIINDKDKQLRQFNEQTFFTKAEYCENIK